MVNIMERMWFWFIDLIDRGVFVMKNVGGNMSVRVIWIIRVY